MITSGSIAGNAQRACSRWREQIVRNTTLTSLAARIDKSSRIHTIIQDAELSLSKQMLPSHLKFMILRIISTPKPLRSYLSLPVKNLTREVPVKTATRSFQAALRENPEARAHACKLEDGKE